MISILKKGGGEVPSEVRGIKEGNNRGGKKKMGLIIYLSQG